MSNLKEKTTSQVQKAKETAREFTWFQETEGNPQAIADGSLQAGLHKSGHNQWGGGHRHGPPDRALSKIGSPHMGRMLLEPNMATD